MQDNDLGVKTFFSRTTDERALIHFAIKSMDYYYSILSNLSPTDFLYEDHCYIMMILNVLDSKNVPRFEINNIVSEAQTQNVLDKIGGMAYLKSIVNMEVSDANFDYYLDSVLESVKRYNLYKILYFNIEALESKENKEKKVEDLIAKVETDLFDLSLKNDSYQEPKKLSDGIDEYLEKKRKNKVDIIGIPTGFPILDQRIDGLVPGTLHVIAARKKMGKSAFLTNIAIDVAIRHKKTVLYVDTEMSFGEWRDRAISRISGINEKVVKHGGYDYETNIRIEQAKEIIKELKIFHEKMPGYTVDKLVALYKKFKIKENLGLIVFDYLKEPDSSSIERNRKEYQVLGDVTTKLKDLAGSLEIPAITAVQLNRGNDVADSDRIARYADIVCTWEHRTAAEIEKAGYSAGIYKLVIKDARRGGETNEHGIGYNFFKDRLEIKEVPIENQFFIDPMEEDAFNTNSQFGGGGFYSDYIDK